jgi:hypothetical protein
VAPSAPLALHVIALLLAFALTLSSIELLSVRGDFAGDGVFVWAVLRDDVRALPRPLGALLDLLLGDRSFPLLLVLQWVLALCLPWTTSALVPALLLLTGLLVCLRFRGTYNGGSDAMTLVVVLGLLIARLGPNIGPVEASTVWQRAGLGYIAAQLVLSYALAGLAKLRAPSWRNGTALPRLLAMEVYAVPLSVRRALSATAPALCASWLVILFECAFPAVVFVCPLRCAVMLTCGTMFHLFNALALGLNRFLWVWLAGYPALLFWSGQLS